MLVALVAGVVCLGMAISGAVPASAATPASLNATFSRAASEYGVPAPLLKAICYMEGRLGDHGGTPSVDGGYGCMHLVRNDHADTLDQAARLVHSSSGQLRDDLDLNVLGGAAVLRAEATRMAPNHAVPTTLAGWYGAVAEFSDASSRSVALMYADAVYQLLRRGFSATAQTGETVTLAPSSVTPDTATAAHLPLAASALPTGCTNDGDTDYTGAVDCIVNPSTFDCTKVASGSPCTYNGANRPTDYAIDFVTIHDVEGTAQDALSTFQNASNGVSAHYVVGGDGTVYQVVHEHDIAFHAGNYYYNEHAVGVEDAGYDASGYQWYNATEYLASAKLVAYLVNKYSIPLDRAHIVAHGTIPAPTLGTSPNHVDPGPYWLWDYYFGLIHDQGVPYAGSTGGTPTASSGTFELQPASDQQPLGSNGAETTANYSFFKLYTGPSTKDALVPNANCASDPTDETCTVEPRVTYYYVAKQSDAAGTGIQMYEVWYGENDGLQASKPSYLAHAKLAWLAVPQNAAVTASTPVVTLNGSSSSTVDIYGEPNASSSYVIGSAPGGAVFSAPLTLDADGTSTPWYVIDFNHRQAWVPASAVTVSSS